MNDLIRTSGIILSASPVGDHDKRLLIETCELGKISAFVRGGRRQGSSMLAASNPFVTGEFFLLPGRDSYRLVDVSVKEYFRELSSAIPEVYIGFYFLDLIDYYGREGIDGKDMLNLTYLALKALLRKDSDMLLVKSIFELRLIVMNGEYSPMAEEMDEHLFSVIQYIAAAPLQKLFSFDLNEPMKEEVRKTAAKVCRRMIDRPLKSEKIMKMFLGESK